ncbi:MAG: ABC-F family ATP-binding cassette domain-containing protein [Lachnospiraceae bacterium]|nr:ABC-F family ATP-binding cassette domain-containing protein [Lachnospiraceae bacterium]
MILSVSNINKSFNEIPVLKDVSFHIEDYDKAAIVGINGAGKTTLLRIIMGDLSADQGIVTISRDKTIGYLSQHEAVSGENTIYHELLSVKQDIIELEQRIRSVELQMKNASDDALKQLMDHYSVLTHTFESSNGYAYKSELVGVLKGLGFSEDEFTRSVSTLSGGQKTRVALGKLLLLKPDLIILDEPTNHLDMSSITWLENYLRSYKGAVIIVSHDRYFLDRIANKIIEIDNTESTVFAGNYSDYAAKKEVLRTAKYNAYMKQQQEIKHQEAVIEKLKSFNREKSIRRAESREKMLDKIEVLEKPAEVRADMHLKLEPKFSSGNDVLHVENLSKSFGSLTLFEHLAFDIKKGEHVAIIGDNGTGKTTILKLINELIAPDTGIIHLGANVAIGYYDQEHHVLHMDKTLFEEISDDYPTLTNTEIRNTLAAFLFTGEDVFKQIKTLSGGERGRVSLAKLMLSEANFLILDEPTNHLDIMSKEILEDAINAYAGTVLYVSHDRYFINKTATRILDLNHKVLTNYLGNYEYYLEKRDEQLSLIDNARQNVSSISADSTAPQGSSCINTSADLSGASTANGKQDWIARKEQQAAQRKKENELKKCEERIEQLETRNEEIDTLMASPEICTDVAKLQELNKEKEANDTELADLYEKWELLSE